jgi:hypothetical protein
VSKVSDDLQKRLENKEGIKLGKSWGFARRSPNGLLSGIVSGQLRARPVLISSFSRNG